GFTQRRRPCQQFDKPLYPRLPRRGKSGSAADESFEAAEPRLLFLQKSIYGSIQFAVMDVAVANDALRIDHIIHGPFADVVALGNVVVAAIRPAPPGKAGTFQKVLRVLRLLRVDAQDSDGLALQPPQQALGFRHEPQAGLVLAVPEFQHNNSPFVVAELEWLAVQILAGDVGRFLAGGELLDVVQNVLGLL